MKSVKMFGKSVPLIAIVMVAVLSVGAFAAYLDFYGKIQTTVDVVQGVIVDDIPYDTTIVESFAAIPGGTTICSPHFIENRGSYTTDVFFNWAASPDAAGIDVKYFRPLGYSFSLTITTTTTKDPVTEEDVLITVVDGECEVTWTVDFPIDADLGNGALNLGLIIADADGVPLFQVHNNDGTDSSYAWGTWLYSPWGPTITDGWFGWHSSNINTPVADLHWLSATGHRHHDDNPTGVLSVTISKAKLGEDFYWAIFPTIGSGFYDYYDVGMQYPGTFSWSDPVGTGKYELANLMVDLGGSLTLLSTERVDFVIGYYFSSAITPDTYVITTTVSPPAP